MAGWTLLALGVVVAAVWVWSGWGRLLWEFAVVPGPHATLDRRQLRVTSGELEIDRYEVLKDGFAGGRLGLRPPSGLHVSMSGESPLWRWTLIRQTGDEDRDGDFKTSKTRVGLWPVPLLLWPPAALLLRSGIVARRRAMKGACPKCGYSLAGLAVGASCPECGRASVR